MLKTKQNQFKNNKINVITEGQELVLYIESDSLIKTIESTSRGEGYNFFLIRNLLDTKEVEVEWSNKMTRFIKKEKTTYNLEKASN